MSLKLHGTNFSKRLFRYFDAEINTYVSKCYIF